VIKLMPFGWGKTGEGRQVDVVHGKELPGMAEDFIDFGAFHDYLLMAFERVVHLNHPLPRGEG
jgi:hypothetical protein